MQPTGPHLQVAAAPATAPAGAPGRAFPGPVPTAAPTPGGWLLAALVALLHALFGHWSVSVPYVFGDEAGYLTKAAALAGWTTDAYSSYYPGYALLLAPLYAIDPHTLDVYPSIQLVNALLAGASAWMLLRLAEVLAPDQPPAARWLAAAAVACYAPGMAYSAFALSENLFIPLAVLLGWLLVRQVERPGVAGSLALAAGATWLMLTHPKGVPVVAALGLGWLAGTWRSGPRERMRVLGWIGASALAFGVLHGLGERFFRERMGFYSDGVSGHYPGAGALLHQLAGLLTLDGLRALALQVAGQLFYLGLASLGLALLGLAGLVVALRPAAAGRAGANPGRRAYAVYAVLSLTLTVLMTGFFMRDGGRVDSYFYGRYDEGVVALVLLPALLRCHRPGAWWLAALAVAVLGLVLVAAHGGVLHGQVVELNVFGLQLWRFPGGGAIGADHVDIGVLAAVGSATIALLGLSARRARWQAALVGVLFLLAAGQGAVGYLAPESRTNAARHRIAGYLRRHRPAPACVDYDIRAGEYWQRYNDQVLLLPIRMHESAVSPLAPGQADDGRTRARCSDLVISRSATLGRGVAGARVLEREEGSDERLWLLPRPTTTATRPGPRPPGRRLE